MKKELDHYKKNETKIKTEYFKCENELKMKTEEAEKLKIEVHFRKQILAQIAGMDQQPKFCFGSNF